MGSDLHPVKGCGCVAGPDVENVETLYRTTGKCSPDSHYPPYYPPGIPDESSKDAGDESDTDASSSDAGLDADAETDADAG
jgi:hypothetical protein